MNIETGEIKPMNQLTPAERASGKWVPLPKGYVPKTPTTKRDFTRLQRAVDKRQRRAKRRQRSR